MFEICRIMGFFRFDLKYTTKKYLIVLLISCSFFGHDPFTSQDQILGLDDL